MSGKKRNLEEGYKPVRRPPKIDVNKGFQPTQGSGGPKPKPPSSETVVKPPTKKE